MIQVNYALKLIDLVISVVGAGGFLVAREVPHLNLNDEQKRLALWTAMYFSLNAVVLMGAL